MSKDVPLITDLNECLSTYRIAFQNLLITINDACDSSNKKNCNKIEDCTQELVEADAKLKRQLERMDKWKQRQNKIEGLQKTLGKLSNRVNLFATQISNLQTELIHCISKSKKIQDSVVHEELPSVGILIESSKNLSRTASAAPMHFGDTPWCPMFDDIKNASIFKKTLDINAPEIDSKCFSKELELHRENNINSDNEDDDDEYDSSEYTSEED